MIYTATITTPANTAKADAIETELIIDKGLIWLIEVEFPAGCCGLCQVQIFDCNYQMFPATPGEALRGDNVNARYDDLYLKQAEPYKLRILTWNTDETYQHTLQVRVGLATSQAFMSRYMPSISWDKFSEALAGVTATQEQQKAEAIKQAEQSVKVFEELPPIPK